jgi:thioredoxin reductase (NADPH)
LDVAIIGGGPAGLVAAIYLARLRRTVTIVDASDSRLATITRTRNYPGFPEGITGPELLSALRQQASRYAVGQIAGTVDNLERVDDGFRMAWRGGELTARLVMLATGTSDIVPAMPRLAQAQRKGLLRYCPVCDGYEVIDQEVGVIANGPAGVREALYLRHFTPHLTLFLTADAQALAPTELEQLAQAGVRLAQGPVGSIRERGGRISICHGDQDTSCESLYSALGLEVHSALARSMGAQTDDSGYVLTDRHMATHIPVLYGAGDVVSGLNQIAVAAGSAAIASAAMHVSLCATDALNGGVR